MQRLSSYVNLESVLEKVRGSQIRIEIQRVPLTFNTTLLNWNLSERDTYAENPLLSASLKRLDENVTHAIKTDPSASAVSWDLIHELNEAAFAVARLQNSAGNLWVDFVGHASIEHIFACRSGGGYNEIGLGRTIAQSVLDLLHRLQKHS